MQSAIYSQDNETYSKRGGLYSTHGEGNGDDICNDGSAFLSTVHRVRRKYGVEPLLYSVLFTSVLYAVEALVRLRLLMCGTVVCCTSAVCLKCVPNKVST